MNAEKEKKLIRGCVKNDRKAQKEMYEYFFSTMFNTCKRYVKKDEDALEIVNTGMLIVFTNIDQFKFQGSFEGWIRKIMINKSLDFIRANSKKNKLFVTTEESKTSHLITVENQIIEHIENAELYNYLRALPDVQQTIFNLYAIEGYSHDEIADQLGIKSGTSRWHLSKARESLKKKFEQETAKPASHGK